MSTSLSTFESQIQPIIRDRTGNVVETNDIQDSLNRCIRYLINRHGIYATKNRAEIDIFKDVYEYPLPSDFHDAIELANPGTPTRTSRRTPVEFWKQLKNERNTIAVDTILGDRFLLVNRSSAGSSSRLHDMVSLTDNGTWAAAASTDATNLTADTVNKKLGGASINFDLDVSNSVNDYAAIENSTMTAVDLSGHANKGTLFVWAYIPDSTNVTGFTARWGNDTSNYYEVAITTAYNGRTLRDGWNRLGFAWAGATETGTVTDTAIDYAYLQVTYGASQTDDTDFRFDDISMKSPESMELHYYSTHFVKDSSGVTKTTFSDVSDETLFEDEDDDIFFYWALADAQLIKQTFEERADSKESFNEMLSFLKSRYASERKRESYKYY